MDAIPSPRLRKTVTSSGQYSARVLKGFTERATLVFSPVYPAALAFGSLSLRSDDQFLVLGRENAPQRKTGLRACPTGDRYYFTRRPTHP
jgi:hypothetical protein